jgi:hypothetical protein
MNSKMNKKLKMGLSGMSVSQYITRCNAIKSAIANNSAVFVTPDPDLMVLEAAIKLLTTRQEAVEQQSGKDATYLRDEAKTAVHRLMVQLATYVSGVANGNGDIILLSGFDIANSASAVGLLAPPSTIKTQVDGVGEGKIRIYWKGVDRSSGYMVSIAPIDDTGTIGAWKMDKAQRLSHTFENLISGQLYAMRVATISAKGQGTWSFVLTYRPQ